MTDLSMYRANDKTWTLTFKDGDGTPISLVGATLLFTVKRLPNDADTSALISKRVTTHTNATSGITAVTITNSDSNLAIGNYFYDFKLIDSGGNNTTVTCGSFTIKRDITRAII